VTKRDPEATRTAILEAAEEEFLAKGMGETTTSAIARRAGVTKSLIHHHFGSKEALWEEVKQVRFSQYATRQLDILEVSDPTADLLRQSMELYFRSLQRNPQIVRLLAWMFLEDDESCGEMDRELCTRGVEKIAQAQERGELRDDIDPHFVLFSFLALIQHWFQFRDHYRRDTGLEGPTAELDEAYLQAAETIFFRGVGREPDEAKPA
jgi:TetR/AcrR family transcriptional regulator